MSSCRKHEERSATQGYLPRGGACVSCHRRKMKCDGKHPICGQCDRAGCAEDCEYTTGQEQSTVQILEENISRLEARIQELQNPDASSSSAPVQLHQSYGVSPSSEHLFRTTNSSSPQPAFTLGRSGVDHYSSSRTPDCDSVVVNAVPVGHGRTTEVVYFLSSMITTLQTLGVHRLLARYFAYQPLPDAMDVEVEHTPWVPTIPGDADDAENMSAVEVLEHNQWCGVLEILAQQWRYTCKGCMLVLPLSLGFLQIGDIYSNIYSRTTVIAAFICSGIGLMSGVAFLYADSRFKAKSFRSKWVSSSEYMHTTTANSFWACLALPISLLAWSVLFIALSITITVCMSPVVNNSTLSRRDLGGPGQKEISGALSMIFLLALAIGHGTQVFRAARLLVA